MIKTIENIRDNIFNPREGPHSIEPKSSNENTKNDQKKSLLLNSQITTPKIQAKNDIKHFGKLNSYRKIINNKSGEENIEINDTDSIPISINEQNNKKEFIEKKRRRRNRCSYSNNRNKKTKKRVNIPSLSQSLTKEILNNNIINQKTTTKKISSIHLQEKSISEEANDTEKGEKSSNPSNQNSKKKLKVDEKELIANAEKAFMEKLNKEYSDEDYNKDLSINLKEKRAQFMKENFPIMFRKDKYYFYTVLLKKRRTQPINFIQPSTLSEDIQESRKHQTLYLNEDIEYCNHVLSENSSEDKSQTIKNKIIPTMKKFCKNQKYQIKNNSNHLINSEIIPPINQTINNKNKCKTEVEKIKLNLTEPKQPIKEKNKKYSIGLSDTSQSDHEAKNLEINHLIDDIEEQNLNNKQSIKFKKTYNLLPKHIWSFPKDKDDLNIEMFFDDCIQIWPFNECIFVKEIALEFLMKNNYSTTICLNRIKDFVSFMKKRAEELNISLINKNEKTVKKYSLRNIKNN